MVVEEVVLGVVVLLVFDEDDVYDVYASRSIPKS